MYYKSSTSLPGHLYVYRYTKNPTFQVFFKSISGGVIDKIKAYNQFKFFFHIYNICSTFVLQRSKKSNNAEPKKLVQFQV